MFPIEAARNFNEALTLDECAWMSVGTLPWKFCCQSSRRVYPLMCSYGQSSGLISRRSLFSTVCCSAARIPLHSGGIYPPDLARVRASPHRRQGAAVTIDHATSDGGRCAVASELSDD